jgi:hypothetical protein
MVAVRRRPRSGPLTLPLSCNGFQAGRGAGRQRRPTLESMRTVRTARADGEACPFQVVSYLGRGPIIWRAADACFGPQTRIAGSRCRVDAGQICPPYTNRQKNDFNDAKRLPVRARRRSSRRPRPRSNWICRLCIPASAVTHRYYQPDSRLHAGNAGSPYAGVSASYARNCPPSLRHAPTPFRPACCVSSRSWQVTGTGWISASMAYPTRSRHWPVKIRPVRA